MEAIILAGGFGTRLKSVISDIPKPMAPINRVPFLEYILEYLFKSKIDKVILSVGYKYEVIRDYFKDDYKGMRLIYSVESEPLGTGGAIRKAMEYADEKDVFILNGDTYFALDLSELSSKHLSRSSDLTMAVTNMYNFDRYGSLIANNDRLISFEEKKQLKEGLINAGVYISKTNLFDNIALDRKFSFEQDFLAKHLQVKNIYLYKSNGYFIDIGIPEDYARAQEELVNYI